MAITFDRTKALLRREYGGLGNELAKTNATITDMVAKHGQLTARRDEIIATRADLKTEYDEIDAVVEE